MDDGDRAQVGAKVDDGGDLIILFRVSVVEGVSRCEGRASTTTGLRPANRTAAQ